MTTHHDNLFDIEGYNYIMNKQSCFLDGEIANKKYNYLSYILRNFQRVDAGLLELLHYT